MIENRDGSFGPIVPAESILEQFAKAGIPESAAAVHFGSFDELSRKRTAIEEKVAEMEKNTLEHRVDDLEKKINKIMVHLKIDDKSEVLIF